jgi:hypothetical protein
VIATDLLHVDWYQENLRLTLSIADYPSPIHRAETIVIVDPGSQVPALLSSDEIRTRPAATAYSFALKRHSRAVKRCVTLLLWMAILMALRLPVRTHSLRARVTAV